MAMATLPGTAMVRVMAVRAVWTVVVMRSKHGKTPFKI
jgi:hypothetical protein